MKKVSLVTFLLLTTSCLFNNAPLKAMEGLLDKDEEVDTVNVVGWGKFIEEKAKITAQNQRLSTKGDLPGILGAGILRRRFYTIGDGDCFFWATDTTRAQAIDLWLNHANKISIRILAHEEIYDEFMANYKLPEDKNRFPKMVREIPLYNELCGAMREIDDVLLGAPLELREDILHEKTMIENRIKYEFCVREDVYRNYVIGALGERSDYLLHAQDGGGYSRTYFIDALADILNKHLIVWSYDEDRSCLIKSHEYIKPGASGVWEVLHEGRHYTRLVPTHDIAAINTALLAENAQLSSLEEYYRKSFRSNKDVTIDLLMLDRYENLIKSPDTSQEEKSEYLKNISKLKAQRKNELQKKKTPSPRMKAAYYKALLSIALKDAQDLQLKVDTPPQGPTARELAMAKQQEKILIQQNKDPKSGSLSQHIERKYLAIKKFESEQLPSFRKELSRLTKEIQFYKKILQELNISPAESPTERNIADILLQLALYYGDLVDITEAEIKGKGHPKEKNIAQQDHTEAVSQKKKFGKAFEELQKTISHDINFQIHLNTKSAKKRLEDALRQDLKLKCEGQEWSFKDDFNKAQAVVTAHFRGIDRKTQPSVFNSAYLSADPFLGKDLPDINEAYPKDISDEEWKTTIPQELYKGLLYMLVPEANRAYVLNNIHMINHKGVGLPKWSLDLDKYGTKLGWDTLENVYDTVKQRENKLDKVWLRLDGRFIPIVSTEEINRLSNGGMSKHDLLQVFLTLNSVFDRLDIDVSDKLADQKKRGRKRFQRIIDTMVKKAREEVEEGIDDISAVSQAKAHAAIMFTQNYGRCSDGIMDHLDKIENELFMQTSVVEAAISNIFSEYAHNFCEKFADFGLSKNGRGVDNEWRTNAPQFVKQRTFFSLPHKGAPRQTFYSLPGCVSGEANGILSAFILMKTFLKGGPLTCKSKTINFEAFTAEKAINLVYEAYKRGLEKVKVGSILTAENVTDFIQKDPYLFHLYENFSEELEKGNINSEFFGTRKINANGQSYNGVEFKRPVFEYLLEKLGYLLNPNSRWKKDSDAFLSKQKEEFDQKIKDLLSKAEKLTPKPKSYKEYFEGFLPEMGASFREYNKSPLTDVKILQVLFPNVPEGQYPDQETATKKFAELAANGRPYATLFKPPSFKTPYEAYFEGFLPEMGASFREYNYCDPVGSKLSDDEILQVLFPGVPEGQYPDQETATKKFAELVANGRPYATLFKPPSFKTPYEAYFEGFLPAMGDSYRKYNNSSSTNSEILKILFPKVPEGQYPDQKTATDVFSYLASRDRPYATLFKPPSLKDGK